MEAVSFNRTVADLKQGVATATAAQTEASERLLKSGKDFAAFNQGTLEAAVQAGQIYSSGAQELLRQMAESGQAGYAELLNSLRAIVTAKTIKERIELQSNLMRTAAVWSVSETSRFAHAGIELAEKAAAPLTARAILAAEMMSTQKAA